MVNVVASETRTRGHRRWMECLRWKNIWARQRPNHATAVQELNRAYLVRPFLRLNRRAGSWSGLDQPLLRVTKPSHTVIYLLNLSVCLFPSTPPLCSLFFARGGPRPCITYNMPSVLSRAPSLMGSACAVSKCVFTNPIHAVWGGPYQCSARYARSKDSLTFISSLLAH